MPFSKLENLSILVNRFSAVITIAGTMSVALGTAIWYASKLDSSITSFNDSIQAEHSNMRTYVDSHLETTNVRIDDLENTLEKTNEQVILISQRVDSSMGRIEEMNKETSDRLDKIYLMIDEDRDKIKEKNSKINN